MVRHSKVSNLSLCPSFHEWKLFIVRVGIIVAYGFLQPSLVSFLMCGLAI